MLTLIVSLLIALSVSAAQAATPASGTITATSTALSYTSGPFYVPNPSGNASLAGGGITCNAALPCDDYALTVSVPSSYSTTQSVSIKVGWPNATADFDLYVLDANGNDIQTSATSSDPEEVVFPALSGTYTVRVVPYVPLGQSITAQIALAANPTNPPPATGKPARFQNYAAPNGLGTSAGEPSIGVNWNTGNVMYQANLQTLRVSFDDTTSPAKATWLDKSAQTALTSLDPGLFTDHFTGRTITSQLLGTTSLSSYSDNDGLTWTPDQGGGIASGVDHQTLGGGPFAPGLIKPITSYPDTVYYCSQDIADAACALSLDGGLTFGPAVPIYTTQQCGGLHGHVKVAFDGTVYVPNKSCGSTQGLVVSTDNGTTWTVHSVPGSLPADCDPSVGIGANGTVYFGYQNRDGHPRIAVSHDHGQTWQNDQDVGAAFHIQNTVFPAVVAGDDDRAAYTFIGTPTGGNYQDTANFTGMWHLYVAATYDGGKSWITTDATPKDPVQRGSICTAGTTCGNDRNLLDYIDVTVDKQGRILVGYADGCIGSCVSTGPNSFSALATIARQSGGRRLFAQYDPPTKTAAVPAAPNLTAIADSQGVHLAWPEPDSGDAPIIGYRMYRGTTPGTETLLGQIGPKLTLTDTSADPRITYYYKATAINANGEGVASVDIAPVRVRDTASLACSATGVRIATDATGDAPANAKDLDIQALSVAEPYTDNGADTLVFTLKVADLSTLPANRQWRILWRGKGASQYYVGMTSDATGKIAFDYGSVKNNVPTALGAADAGGYSADGTITIAIASAKVGNGKAGARLTDLSARTFANQPTVAKKAAADSTTSSTYRLIGNAACEPNTAPTALLTPSVTHGDDPLTVTFDGAASFDSDKGDSIASYTFDFGDGSARVTQKKAAITHLFKKAGEYRVHMSVTDSRGKHSDYPAQFTLFVGVDDGA